MGSILKIVGLLTAGRRFADSQLFQRYITQIIQTVAATVLFALFTGALVLGGFAAIYRALVVYTDLNTVESAGIVLGLLFVLVLVAGIYLRSMMRRLRNVPQLVQYAQAPMRTKVESVVDAFIDGVKNSDKAYRNDNRF